MLAEGEPWFRDKGLYCSRCSKQHEGIMFVPPHPPGVTQMGSDKYWNTRWVALQDRNPDFLRNSNLFRGSKLVCPPLPMEVPYLPSQILCSTNILGEIVWHEGLF